MLMRKLFAILLLVSLLAPGVIVLTGEAEAGTIETYAGETRDGGIYCSVSGSTTTYSADASDTKIQVGVINFGSTSRIVRHGFLSFDTSSIPLNAEITSAAVYLRYTTVLNSHTIDVYSMDYGPALESSDYGDGVSGGEFQTTFAPSLGAVSFAVSPASISIGGSTQYEMAMSDETTYFTTGLGKYSRFYSSDEATASYRPHMVIEYRIPDQLSYELAGSVYNCTVYPTVAQHNNTADLYTYEFDTWSGVNNITLEKGAADWSLLGFTPYCTSSTDGATNIKLTGVVQGATYRLYVAVPRTASTSVHVSTYVASTGEGLTFEAFHIKYSAGLTYDNTSSYDVVAPDFTVSYGSAYTIAVLDYFGNVITTQSLVANAAQKYVSIPLDIYSFKVFNQQDDFSRFRIYYNNTGAALSFYCAPMECVERFLRPGPYTVVVTNYPAGIAGASEYFNVTVSDAEFLMLDGTTISRVVSDVEGVAALQRVITALVTPDMVFIKQNMPSVPTECVEYIHPWSIVTATTSSSGTGSDLAFTLPRPDVAGITYTILEDKLTITGNYSTEIWINSTAGTNIYHSAYLQGSVSLAGQNVTIEATDSISVSRETKFRAEELFYYAYYTAQKKYEVVLNLNNSMSLSFANVDWFVGFPENRSIELASVRVQDLDNAVYLVSGLNYDVTSAGIRMAFDSLTAGEARSFKFTFYDLNASSGQGVPIAYADTKEKYETAGDDYYLTRASWTNTYAAAYEGALTIRLDFTGSDRIDASSVIVNDKANSRQLPPNEWYMVGNVITISYAQASVGGICSYEILFKLDNSVSEPFDLFAPLLMLGDFPLSTFALGVVAVCGTGGFAIADRMARKRWDVTKTGIFIVSLSIVAFVGLLAYNGAI